MSPVGSTRREKRAKVVAQLTPRERMFVRVWTLVTIVLPIASGLAAVLGHGTVRAVGIVLLILALFLTAVPISPFLNARVRRRDQR
jgi:hypothetical protein